MFRFISRWNSGRMLLLGSIVLVTAAAAQQSKPIPPVAGRRLKRLPELHSEVISGRFVAQTAATRISAFSPNLQTFIFEADLRGYTQMVKLTHEFLHQEARIPDGVLDYNEPRSLAAVRDSRCDESWESLTTRRVVDSDGVIVGTRPDLVYTRGAPQPATEADEVIPCYVVGRITEKWSERLARSGR